MTTMSKPLSFLYFFSGLLCGLLFGVSLDKRWSDVVTKIIAAGILMLMAFFWRRIESFAHKRYLESWTTRRSRGKWLFVFTEYVLIRGTLLFVAVAGPMLSTITLTTYTVSILLGSVAALILLLAYLGNEEWTACEQDYAVQVFRQAAEQSRIESN